MIFVNYIDSLSSILHEIAKRQAGDITRAGVCVAEAICKGGVVHAFGSGHSHLIAEEAFFRAGGLVPVNPILHPRLTFLQGAIESTHAEREQGFAAQLLRDVVISPNDVALIISNSGRNAVPVEMAMEMKSRNVPIIAITSLQHSQASTAAHPSGKRLFELADIVIDNGAPCGDAVFNLAGVTSAMGPVSTVTGAAIVHSIMLEAAAELVKRNVEVPVFASANLPGASDGTLMDLMRPYGERIQFFDI
jgi:uncharacterized phosphosugar-binding protein